ncbi:MAG: heavy-metal-associated domain-containing protein [Bacteroidota bacterium]
MFGIGEKKETFSVEGMTCHHCEMTVERFAMQVPGVRKAKADHKRKTLEVVYSGSIDRDLLRLKIQEAGYTLIV